MTRSRGQQESHGEVCIERCNQRSKSGRFSRVKATRTLIHAERARVITENREAHLTCSARTRPRRVLFVSSQSDSLECLVLPERCRKPSFARTNHQDRNTAFLWNVTNGPCKDAQRGNSQPVCRRMLIIHPKPPLTHFPQTFPPGRPYKAAPNSWADRSCG